MEPRNTEATVLAGKYVLGELIGAGGMGLVYLAVQPVLQREVAIKILRPELVDDPRMLAQFRREAIAGARLRHPGVVRVFDLAEAEDGRPFLAMEYVPGRLLGEVLRERPMPLARAGAIVAQILAALGEVHRSGIVHADLKADNVMIELDRDGTDRVRVVDFGLARIEPVAGRPAGPVEEPVPECSCVSGTPEYMAPEVISGAAPSPASDLYAVGVILYELLTGTTPFAGDTPVVVLMRHLTDPIVPPSVRRPERPVPRAVEEVVARALEKAPADRFADADEFAAELASALADRPVAAASSPALALPPALVDPSLPRVRIPCGCDDHGRDDEEHRLRRSIADALLAGERARVTAGYLALAALLRDRGDRKAAARELVEGIDVITAGEDPATLPTGQRATLLHEELSRLRPRRSSRDR